MGGVNIMQIARLRICHNQDDKTEDESEEERTTWNYIQDNYRSWDVKDVKPLYLTQRGIHKDISLVVSSKSTDDFAEYILNNLSGLDTIENIWVFNLFKPTFFTIPDNISQNLKRFTIALDIVPKEAQSVYERISKIKPTSRILVTYITYTYQKNSDILISLLAGNRDSVEEFVRDYIEGLKGVIKWDVVPIRKSKNLASVEDWKEYVDKYFYKQDGLEDEDLRIYETWSSMGFE
jgi:hypothetical protein